MKFTPQRMKFLHSIDGLNYSLDFLEGYFAVVLAHFVYAAARSSIYTRWLVERTRGPRAYYRQGL